MRDMIIAATQIATGVGLSDMREKCSNFRANQVRRVVMRMLTDRTDLTDTEIAHFLGRRGADVRAALRTHTTKMFDDPTEIDTYNEINALL